MSDDEPDSHYAAAFGLRWRADVSLTRFTPATPGDVDVIVERVDALFDRSVVRRVNRGHVCADGVRFTWEREVTFDMYAGSRVSYAVGPDWRGSLPLSFYSTVAALTLAWRGAIPLHACAVEVDGRAILICGAGGAGKSTLTAGLIAEGAKFIADDLTAVVPSLDGTRLFVPPGRPVIRLHPAIAGWIGCMAREPEADDPGGKWLARPSTAAISGGAPLAAMLLLGHAKEDIAPMTRHPLVRSQIFRPRWMAALPDAPALRKSVFQMARTIVLARFDPGAIRSEHQLRQRARAARELLTCEITCSQRNA
jgi:hypothetical protein